MKTRKFVKNKLILLSLMFFIPVFSLSAADGLTAAVDTNPSSYTPTQIINGDFSIEPWMDYKKNNITITYSQKSTQKDNHTNIDGATTTPSSVYNAIGWNTTEIRTFTGSLFEYCEGGYVEMNCFNAAILYQDLPTTGYDVIKWTLKHQARDGYDNSMQVVIGAPKFNGNQIVPAHGIGNNINTEIVSGEAIYKSTGITKGNGTVGFANSNELLMLDAGSTNNGFQNVVGIYVVPEGQKVTRFGFMSLSTQDPSCGNYLDDITFNTLIGNLTATRNKDDSVTIRGYWGDESSKKLIVIIGNETYQINMSGLTNQNFIIEIGSDVVGNAGDIEVYHEDFECAKRIVHIPGRYSQTKQLNIRTGYSFVDGFNKDVCKTESDSMNIACYVGSDAQVNNSDCGSFASLSGSIEVYFKNGFKYYDGSLYDIHMKLTNRRNDEANSKWTNFFLKKYRYTDNKDYYFIEITRNVISDFDYEIWLTYPGTNITVKDVNLVAGSCFIDSSEGSRPWSDDGFVYTTNENYTWDSVNKGFKSSDNIGPSKFIFGHGQNSENHVMNGFWNSSSSTGAEIILGYEVKEVSFEALDYKSNEALDSVTFEYEVLNVPVGKALKVLPSVLKEGYELAGWLFGEIPNTYTSNQVKSFFVNEDMTVRALLVEHVHDWRFYVDGSQIKAKCFGNNSSGWCKYQKDSEMVTIEIKPVFETILVPEVGPADATDKTVYWSSSDTGVVIVDENGKVTGLQTGFAYITASSGDGNVSTSVKINVPDFF